jgi:LysM repeat protein
MRGALAVALFGLGCGGEIWYLNPELFGPQTIHPQVVAANGERACELAGRSSDPVRHRVVPGETLAGLARWYGLPVSNLARANGIRDPDRIAAGSWLRIPPGARTGCPPPLVVASAPRERPASAAQAPPPAEPVEVSHEEARRMLVRAQSRYDAADFGEALEFASASLRLLEPFAGAPQADRLRANGSWISGLVYTGLEQPQSAVESFRTALELDPSLADAGPISPKVRTLVDRASVALVETPP